MASTTKPGVARIDPTGPVLMWTLRITSVVALLAAWEWYGRRPDSFTIAPVTDVARAMWDGFASGEFGRALAGTMLTMVVGYVIAAVIGVGVGLWIGVSRYAQNTIEPLVHAGYATPVSLLIPILGIYTGLELRGRIILVVLWCVFEILVNTSTGIKEVPPALIDVGKSFNASRFDLYRKVVLPAARPYIFLGLKIGVGRAIRGAVTAELLLSAANLGRILLGAQSTFDIPTLLAGIVLTMLLGLVLMQVASYVERRSLSYRAV
ncbi:ABC transporter permease [Jiangella alkaliphila]|uniref:NitT/TauT family transport system permease protein n=1 Tax=Jiangella alkaliphila TaxID=419479 RepID=A0A1H2I0I1_9ACTN|nr:ABC transporter permease [Jiangella alkaliphila]SDU37475.1 NitT/TauT family transport system permease protein [Jiangella alkaliphila]